MRNILRTMAVIMLFGSTIGVAFGATVTFDKTIDVPDRKFTVEYPDDNNKTFTFTIDNLGNYKFGDSIGVTVNGGANRIRLVSWSVDKLSPWHDSYNSPGGSISTTIPADSFDPSCQDVCGDKMGHGIYALTVQDMTSGPPYNYITAKPFIISEYDLTVTPDKTQVEPGSSINVTVNIKKSGNLFDMTDNIKVEFVQDSTGTHFGEYATKISTGTYSANIQIPQTATGTHLLYAAITTDKNIYQDYPEIMGADSGGSIQITTSASTQTTTPPSSGGSGGGGGGGGISGEDYSNIEVKEKYELDILNNKITSYRFKNASNPINFINITGNISAGATTTSVEVLKYTSSLVKTQALGLVYKNMNIWVGTSGFAVPRNIKTAVIGFKVDNSWIKTNGLSSSDVKMVKWDGSQWIQLETREMDKSGEFTLYEATTNSFSPFAIVAKMLEIPGTMPGLTQQPTTTQTPTEVPTEPIAIQAGTHLMIAVAIILIVIIAAFVSKESNRKEK